MALIRDLYHKNKQCFYEQVAYEEVLKGGDKCKKEEDTNKFRLEEK